jgi:hypothetical protein
LNNKWRVYIKAFDDNGVYNADWEEVTDDVIFGEIGSINSDLDNTDYDIGVYRFSNFKITLRNDHARYSDVDYPDSIFRYKRADSLVKITWEINDEGPFVGIAESESGFLSEEVTIFTGLLNDESLVMNLSKQTVSFSCIGKEYLFSRTTVPFGSVSNGDLFSEILYTILNQANITALLTVSSSNISCGTDLAIDSIASLQNKTVQEGLNKLLLASNSVLFIENDTVYIAPRTASPTVEFTFYGQTSSLGAENILDVTNIKNGLNKVFNYFTWKDTIYFSQSTSSVTKYGVRKNEVDFEFITDGTKQQTILDNLKTEFADPKQEFDIITPMSYPALEANLLSRVSIDYPIVYVSTGDPVPICGVAICGEAVLPKALSAFTILPTDHYKVIGRSINPKDSTIRFKVRKI